MSVEARWFPPNTKAVRSIVTVLSVRPRNESLKGLVSPLKNVPSLEQLSQPDSSPADYDAAFADILSAVIIVACQGHS